MTAPPGVFWRNASGAVRREKKLGCRQQSLGHDGTALFKGKRAESRRPGPLQVSKRLTGGIFLNTRERFPEVVRDETPNLTPKRKRALAALIARGAVRAAAEDCGATAATIYG